jgi:electron transport complex protein RnfB
MAYIINKNGCVACGACKLVCLFNAVDYKGEGTACHYEIKPEVCTGCGRCADVCIAQVITPDENQKRILSVKIDPEKCIGCSLCARFCPVKAVSGEVKKPYIIDEDVCIKCGVCLTKCRRDAIEVAYAEPASPQKSSKSLFKGKK